MTFASRITIAIAAVIVGMAAARAPAVTVAAVLAAVGVVVALILPRTFVGGGFVLVMLSRAAQQATGVSGLQLADEAFVGACFLLALLHAASPGRRLRPIPGLKWLAIFVALGVTSAVARGVPTEVLVQGTALPCKLFVLAFAVAQFDWDLRIVARWGAAFTVFVIACSAVNLALPSQWNALFANSEAISFRSALPSLIGPFTHPGELAPIAALSFIGALAWRAFVGRSTANTALIVGAGAASVLAFRRKTWAGLVAALLAVQSATGSVGAVAAGLLVGTAGLLLFWSAISTVVGELISLYLLQEQGAAGRTIMTQDSFEVSVGYFPLGAGFGRFGSETAATNYSPEYLERGYQGIWGLSPALGNDRFLTDNTWPAILGETGVFGLLAFVLAMLAVLRSCRRLLGESGPREERWLAATGIAVLVQYALESLGSPVVVAAPLYLPLALLIGLVASVSNRRQHPSTPAALQATAPAPRSSAGTP